MEDALCAAENVVNNTTMIGGYTPAQRVYGRGTSIFRNMFCDSLTSASAIEEAPHVIKDILDVQEKAAAMTREVINNQKMRRILAERVRPQVKKWNVEDKVY